MFRFLAAITVAVVPALTLSLSQAALAQTPVKIGVFGILAEAGLYVAQERGYFKQEGLDVEFLPGMIGPDALPALATGRLDAVGGSFQPGIVNAVVKRGLPIKIVAALSSYSPGWDSGFLLVRKELIDQGKVKDWKDLKGLSMAVATGRPGLGDYITSKALAKGGLTLDDVKIIEMPFTNVVAALKTGGIDAAHSAEPQATIAGDGGIAVKWHAASEYLPPAMTVAMLQFGPTLAQEKPAIGEKLVTALLRGARDYDKAFTTKEGKADIVAMLVKHTVVKNAALYERMGPSYAEPDGTLNIAELNAQAAFYAKYGASDPIDAEKIVDQRFRNAALAKLGPYKP
jgi:NitT/TauT family transport system substrate-binding protein